MEARHHHHHRRRAVQVEVLPRATALRPAPVEVPHPARQVLHHQALAAVIVVVVNQD